MAVRLQPQEVVVSVSDTGVGIPPHELPRIFDEFHQVDMSLRRPSEGAGLGLAISKRFVELHDLPMIGLLASDCTRKVARCQVAWPTAF